MLALTALDSQLLSSTATRSTPIYHDWLTGAQDWSLTTNRQTIKGFTDKVSAADGELVSLFVTTPALTFDILVFRLGWYYSGLQAADLVGQIRNVVGIAQPSPQVEASTGLVSAAHWRANVTLSVAGWPTGLYLLKLVAADGDQNYLPLVVRDDHASHDVLFVHSVNTDQAYNGWGGKSLYTFNSTGPLTVGGTVAAVKASFDRPFDQDGAGTALLSWELNMVRWLEANHLDVAYATDVDVHRDPQFASRFKAVIQAGHSEYWSKEMRDHLEEASSQGKGLGFFTGDTGSWAVRYEDSPLGRNRVLVCYRNADLDPITATDPSRTTTHWLSPPLNRPLQAFIGVGSNAMVAESADWIVAGVETAPELFADTGFEDGDVVPHLVGYEYDGVWTPGAGNDLPDGLTILGRARVIPGTVLGDEFQFGARYDLPATDPVPLGQLSLTVESLRPGPAWVLFVNVVSSERSVLLQYETDIAVAYLYKDGRSTNAVFPLPQDDASLGGQTFVRDLQADYTTAFGKPPNDARIAGLELRGSLGLRSLSITDPDGAVYSAAPVIGRPKETNVWYVAEGKGSLDVQTSYSSPDTTLVLQSTLPTDRHPEEADTVVVKRPNSGLIIAAGTMQWAWALDDVGTHVDKKGNETKVDPRIQALTRNMLRQLIAGRGD